jgi:Raf kinase inhibitor-like YbhB/YbcL family protein
MITLTITSPAFDAGGKMPARYTCDGAGVNPPLHIAGIPPAARSLALIVDDPDAPGGMFVHWVVWNIPVTTGIEENSIPGNEAMNDYRRRHYGEPCPPSGTHRYFFKVYALDAMLDLPDSTSKKALEKAMKEYIVGYGELMGLYSR